MSWFVLDQRQLWGGLGRVLIGGFYKRFRNGPMLLERTGPFVPPFFIPWGPLFSRPVVSDTFKTLLTTSGFGELGFRRAIKWKIVHKPWHEWDLAADNPQEMPTNEPCDYVWGRMPNLFTAFQMEKCWELILPVSQVEYRLVDPDDDDSPSEAVLKQGHTYPRWFYTREQYGDIVVSPHVREWLQSTIPDWVHFGPLRHSTIA